MTAGRRPKPTALKLVTGNPGRRPLSKDEPQPPVVFELPPCPSRLKGAAAEYWREEGALLVELRVLTLADLKTFEALCWCWGEVVALRAALAKGRLRKVVSTQGEEVERERPEVRMLQSALKEFRAFTGLFGLNPTDRARVKAAPAEKAHDPAGGYL